MLGNLIPNLADPRYWRETLSDGMLAWNLIRDNRVPLYVKAIPVAAIAYTVSPIDFIPEFIPVIGQLDDIAILLMALKLFVRLAPAEVVQSYQQRDLGHNES